MSDRAHAFPAGRFGALLQDLDAGRDAPTPAVLLRRARAAWAVGLPDRARAELDSARRRLVKGGDRRDLALANLWLARTEALYGDPACATVPLEKATAVLEREGSPEERLLLAEAKSEAAWAAGRAEAVSIAEERLRLGRAGGDPSRAAEASLFLALVLLEKDAGAARRALAEATSDDDPEVAWRGDALRAMLSADSASAARAVSALESVLASLPAAPREGYLRRRDRARLRGLLPGPEGSASAPAHDVAGSLQPTIDQAMQVAVSATGADRGFLLLFEAADRVSVRSAFHLSREALTPERFRLSFGTIADVVRQGRVVRVERADEHEVYGQHASLHEIGIRSFLAVPIPGDAEPAGLLYLDSTSPRKSFSAEDEALVVRFAEVFGRTVREAAASNRASFEAGRLSEALAAGMKDLATRYRFEALVGDSEAMRRLRTQLDHIARTPYPVLVVGETGTGKEIVAKAIHANCPRRDQPLVAVNCAALSRELLESELFGHVRGAFTGADRDRAGLLRAAQGGTLFLDEIGEMPFDLQSKLLRVLQEGEFSPVGSGRTLKCDIRVIAATNREVEEEVRKGRFREDLYYRLKVFKVVLPPLRDRLDDVPILVSHLVGKVAQETGGGMRTVSAEALSALSRYTWPGNVRELENAIRHAAAFSEGEIRVAALPAEVVARPLGGGVPREWERAAAGAGAAKPVDAAWIYLIKQALDQTGWNQSEAARQLGISRVTLKRRMDLYGIRRKGAGPQPE